MPPSGNGTSGGGSVPASGSSRMSAEREQLAASAVATSATEKSGEPASEAQRMTLSSSSVSVRNHTTFQGSAVTYSRGDDERLLDLELRISSQCFRFIEIFCHGGIGREEHHF